jgi:hypothetical protein
VISLLDLGVKRLRDAMTFGAPETEALYEGAAQRGFGVPSIDGSPVPLGSTATHEPIEIPRGVKIISADAVKRADEIASRAGLGIFTL